MKLYHLPGCPFCEHVLARIDELNIAHEIELVPVPRAHEERTELSALTGEITGVPTLVDGETIIPDDDDKIIAYLDEKFAKK